MTMQCPGEMLNVMLQSSGMPHRQGTDLYILTKTSVGRVLRVTRVGALYIYSGRIIECKV
jgi:hypothetical protein